MDGAPVGLVARMILMGAAIGRSRLGLVRLIHALHLAVFALHLLAALLAVMLALLVLTMIDAGGHRMASMWVSRRSGLRKSGNGDG